MRTRVRSLASLSGSGTRRCHVLWCRSQTQLGSRVAVAVAKAASCSSDLTPSLGTSMCHRCGPKKEKKRKERGKIGVPTVSQQVTGGVLGALAHRFDPWPGTGLRMCCCRRCSLGGDYSSDLIPCPGNTICCGVAKKKRQNKI